MTNTRSVRGIRSPIPAGHVIGRISAGDGDAELIAIPDLGNQLVGLVPAVGVSPLAPIATHTILANPTGVTATPIATTLPDATAGIVWVYGATSITITLADDLAALEGLSTTGLATRTAASTWTTRTLTQPAAGITVSNGDGVAGNPTLALANDLAALEAMAGTGLVTRTGSETYTQRTITGTASRISISNGSGVAGNPTIDIDVAYVGQTSITTLGTIATGTWNGTIVGVTYGGTGANLSATGGASQVLKQASAGATITVGQLAASDLSNGVTGSGAVALANTPTLITPVLGVATATSLGITGAAGAGYITLPTQGAVAPSSPPVNDLKLFSYAGELGILKSTGVLARLNVGPLTLDREYTFPNVSGDFVTTGDSGTVTNTMLAGSIANAKLTNSSLTIGSTSISLGATSTTLAGLTSVTTTGGSLTGLTGLAIRDTSAAFDVTLAATSSTALTAGRTLTLDVKNVAHTLAFGSTANTITFPSVASYTVIGTGNLTDITTVALTSGTMAGITSFALRDTSAAFDVTVTMTSAPILSAGRILTVDMGNVAHTINLNDTANTITFPNAASYTVAGLGVAQTFSAAQAFSSTITPSSTNGIVGTTTNDNANAGSIGEYASSIVLTGSAVSLTTNVAADVTSLSLTAGDWNVEGLVAFNISAVATVLDAQINTTSATLDAVPADGKSLNQLSASNTSGIGSRLPTGTARLSLSGTTTVYLVARAIFASGTSSAYGILRARRVR